MILFKVALRHLLCLLIARKVLFPIKFMTLDQKKRKEKETQHWIHTFIFSREAKDENIVQFLRR